MIFTESIVTNARVTRQRVAADIQWLKANPGKMPMGCIPRAHRIRDCMRRLAWAHTLEAAAKTEMDRSARGVL